MPESRKYERRERGLDRDRAEQEQRAHIPLPLETVQDNDLLVAADLELKSLADEAYEEFVKNGGLERLPGLGKPLVVPTGDILTSIMKQADIQPPWIMLRKEIGANMKLAISLLDKTPDDPEIDALLDDTNKQIAELNHQAPSLSLHRKKLTRDNLREQYARWYNG